MKLIKLLLSAILVFFLLFACRSETKDSTTNQNFLKEGKITQVSPFSSQFGIIQIDVISDSNNTFYVKTLLNTGKTEKFRIRKDNNKISVQYVFNKVTYILEKNIIKNESVLIFNGKVRKVSPDFIDTLNADENYAANRLLFIFVELFDENVSNRRTSFNKGTSCAYFYSSIGITATAAKVRAEGKAQQAVLADNVICVIRGTDVSCALDAHVCIATTTVECAC